MTFVKDNKMWLIKDVSVILKSKGEFFWKGFIIGIGVTFLFHYRFVLTASWFSWNLLFRQNCFQRKTEYLFL